MFSPEATLQGGRSSLRNPRRRQRKDSDGLQQQPRRKRSKLSEDTFRSSGDAHVNGNGSVVMNGHATHGDADGSLVLVDMPVREKKVPVKRALRDDTSAYLTKHANYSLKKLPSFPDTLAQASKPFRAFALPSAGLALALTTTHALAWDYTSPTGPTRALNLPLPFNLKPSDSLPLGSIVRNGPTNDFGVLAIAPVSGKIVFWENVDSAEARSHFAQRPQGVEGTIKMYSSETVQDIVDLEHAGFALILSSGRVAQLTLRDSQGRPSITTTFLNAPNGSGGFFSFKGLLGGVRKSIASVKCRPSESRGQMEVITATKTGVFQMWDLSWSGQQVFKSEVDASVEILATLLGGSAPEARGHNELHFLDFTFLEQQLSRDTASVLVLVALSGSGSMEYSLLEVDLSGTAATVTRAIPLRNYHQTEIPKEAVGTLLLPSPGHTAVVLFPNAISVVSLIEPEESPDAQLLSDSGKPPFPFQDSMYLRQGRHIEIRGSAVEGIGRKDDQANAVLFIQGCGILRLSALRPPVDDEDIGRHKVTAKSKLEQATFFSTIPDNILDFSIDSRYEFSQEEVESAATAISQNILSSSYDVIDTITSSMDDQLRRRATALNTLIKTLGSEYPPLSLETRWALLWNAEKIDAAAALWNEHQAKIAAQQAHPEVYTESLLLPHMVKCLAERWKTPIQAELGETDPVRQFFRKDIGNIGILLPWAWQCLRMFYLSNQSRSKTAAIQRVSEGIDVLVACYEAIYKFRQDNVELYGFDSNQFRDGLLLPENDQDILPEFWTSTHNLVGAVRSLIDVAQNWACEEKETTPQHVVNIVANSPRIVNVECLVYLERFTWGLAQSDEKKLDMGRKLQQEYFNKVRPEHIYNLVEIGQAAEGMRLAEHYQDMSTLARMVWEESRWLESEKAEATSKMEQAECTVKLNRIKERIQGYFANYGTQWTEAFCSLYIKETRSAQLFDKDYVNQAALTKFLRCDGSRSKLSWINEILGEKNYKNAHEALTYAAKKETNAWSKKVELSIAKLALLSTHQQAAVEDKVPDDPKLSDTQSRLEGLKIQEQIFDRMAPTIEGALDDESAVQLLMADYGQGRLAERPAQQQLLQQAFEKLVQYQVLEPALLVDVLTLMTYDESREPTEITQNNEFAFALKVIALNWSDIHRSSRDSLLKLVWKRLCVRDNWAEINNTKDVSDMQLTDWVVNTAVGWTYKAVLQMIDENPLYKRVLPPPVSSLLGAGCTNGELCTRFASEDLRNPILADNIADDEALQDDIEKHRLEHWFETACDAAKQLYESELQAGSVEDEEYQVNGVADEEAAGDVEMMDQ